MDKFWRGAAQFGGVVLSGIANGADSTHRKLESMLENGKYERLTPSQRRKFDELYNASNPENTAGVRAVGERWSKWGRGERD